MSLPPTIATVALALTGLLSAAPAPGRVAIELATLHAAALTTARGAADSTDAPYLLVSVLGAHTQGSVHVPAAGHWRIAEDAVVPPTPVEVLDLAPGDSARVVISVLESESKEPAPEMDGATASTAALERLARPLVDSAGAVLDAVLHSLSEGGAHWLGSVSLLVTNEGGTIWWRRMECVRECAVTKGLPEGSGGVALTSPASGVFELDGAGGTFHMQLRLKQAE